jgi:DNA-binding XRE family transcriptional regulator
MSLDKQLDYYLSLPNYDPIWMALIVRDTVESFIGLFPMFTRGDQFRENLLETATQHLRSRPLTAQPQLTLKPALPAATLSIAQQIDSRRKECRLTAEQLAEKIGIDIRSVQRHLAGKSKPYLRHLREYEKLFTKLLGEDVVLNQDVVKMS